MEPWDAATGVRISLDDIDLMLRRQQDMLDELQRTLASGNTGYTYTIKTAVPVSDTNHPQAEPKALFGTDKQFSDLWSTSLPAAPKTFAPLPSEISESFDKPVQRPVSGPYAPIQPPPPSALPAENFGRPVIAPAVLQADWRPQIPSIVQPSFQSLPAKIPLGLIQANPGTLERSSNSRDKKMRTADSTITDQQLRALSRKHLFILIRDLEKDLQQVTEEKESLLLAYQAGLEKITGE